MNLEHAKDLEGTAFRMADGKMCIRDRREGVQVDRVAVIPSHELLVDRLGVVGDRPVVPVSYTHLMRGARKTYFEYIPELHTKFVFLRMR